MPNQPIMSGKRPKQWLFIAGGSLSIGIGVVGAFLPILPTTPFLLLATYLFARSSDRLYSWLLENRLIGDYLRRYYEGQGMSRRHKAVSLVLLWAMLAVTMLTVSSWWLKGGLAAVGVAVTTHLLLLQGERFTRQ